MKDNLHLKSEESGFALVMALIMLMVGSLIIIPLLSYANTGLGATGVREDKMEAFYAVSAGIEDAINKVRLDYSDATFQLPEAIGDTDGYALVESINGKDVNVFVTNVWPLEGLETNPGAPQENTISVVGTTSGEAGDPRTYTIELVCFQDSLKSSRIDEVGIWLPGGFDYKLNSTEGFTTSNPAASQAYHGGTVFTWDMSDTEFADLSIPENPNPPTSVPIQRSMAFQLNQDTDPMGAICWIKTSTGLYWDLECSTYKITSTATDPVTLQSETTEAYVSRGKLNDRLTLAHGDYRAIGNSLMIDTNHDSAGVRDELLDHSSASLWKKTNPSKVDLPTDAEVMLAYLYWSGWRGSNNQPFTDVKFGIENVTRNPGSTNWSYPISNKSAVLENNTGEYSYSCRADVTTQMSAIASETSQAEFKITLGDAHPYDNDKFGILDNNWSFAGWSLIVIYSSPAEQAHRVYLYDDFLYVHNKAPRNSGTFNLTGFDAPSDSDGYLTYFVGEGDHCWTPEWMKFNGVKLTDGDNPADNIMNGKSSATGASYDGVDIDTYDISDQIHEGDTSATIDYYSGKDIWNLIYTIVSFRSEITESFEGYPVKVITYN